MNVRRYFERRYLDSLDAYRYFYDDVCEYGHADAAQHVFYFIPGLNGVPGQVRFALPSFHLAFGNAFYVQCLYLPEFSARTPIWEKYTTENLEKRQAVIEADLLRLTQRYGHIHVITSSTAFYEFAATAAGLPQAVQNALTVLWVAAAPDQFTPSRWESVFSPLSGIERNGFHWTALPNHNAFAALNPEARSTYRWHHPGGAQTLYKESLESRFQAVGLSWAYYSLECTNHVMRHFTDRIPNPLSIEAYILAGTRDGYWQGKSPKQMSEVIECYLSRPRYLWKKASHLWIMIPENVSELLEIAYAHPLTLNPAATAPGERTTERG